MNRRKRKKWTTKNTHMKKNMKDCYTESERWYDKLETWGCACGGYCIDNTNRFK